MRLIAAIALSFLVFSDQASTQDASPVMPTKITGGDELHVADVKLQSGVKRLQTSATVSVEQLLGRDNIADVWFTVNDTGAIGDTVKVDIASGASGGAVSVTSTTTATEVGQPIKLVDLICTDLNADATFTLAFRCMRIKDNAVAHISSKFVAEFGERPNTLDFQTTTMGTASTTDAFDNIISRQKTNSLARDPDDKRIGTLGISGTVFVLPGGIGDVLILPFDFGGSDDMRVDGSTTPVNFDIACSATQDRFVSEVRLFAGCNGLKFGQFLCKNAILTNGIETSIRSDEETLTLPLLKTTEDFKNKFAFGSGDNFRIDVQAGADQLLAVLSFANPFVIRKCGTFISGDDFVRIKIQDDLTGSSGGNLQEFSALVLGFEREP